MEAEIPEPNAGSNMLTAQDITSGEPVPPLQRLKIIDADRWEDITLELVYYWKTQYPKVVRCGGGGDMGRDVIAYSDQDSIKWENFQCKHYKDKLNVAQAILEIGKLLYYSHKGKFSIPQKYCFVTPQGVSTDLLNHLMDSEKLKSALFSRWDKDCKGKITTTRGNDIKLSTEFRKFIVSVDFGSSTTANARCPPWRAKRRRVVPDSREARLLTGRAHSARGEAKRSCERGVKPLWECSVASTE